MDDAQPNLAAAPPSELYATARLALWAGDLDFSIELLNDCLGAKVRLRRGEKLDFYDDPIAFAARRLRNQISRRRSECRRLLKASGLDTTEIEASPKVLTSAGGVLRGTLWPRNEDRVTMLGYLTSTKEDVHRSFFARVARFGENDTRGTRDANYAVPDEEGDAAVGESTSEPVAFAPSWKESKGAFAVRIVVGDYGTVDATGTWTGDDKPLESEIIPAFQRILDSLDPRVPFSTNVAP